MIYHVQFPGLGLDLTVNRVALAIGGFNIYWYGVIIAAGMLLAMLYAFRNAVDYGIDSDRLVDVVAIGTVMAIVCARIYYVAMAPFEYQSVWEMIDIRKGGIAIYGAVIGAFVFGGLICVIGQLLIDFTKLTPARILVSFVVAGVVLSAVGLYGPFAEFAGAGASVPLTGFGHVLAEGVRKAVREKGLLGALTGGLSSAAAGISAAMLFGLIVAAISKPSSK